MSNVIDGILKKCRAAILGGIPILYIKTDSDILIRKIVGEENHPLVQLLIGRKIGGSRYFGRPLSEIESSGVKCGIDDADNFKNSLPTAYETITYPHVWAYKMPKRENIQECASAFKSLEKYILAHEDKNNSKYDILRYSVVLLYSSEVNISSSLMPYAEFIDVDYPNEDEIRDIILRESLNDLHLVADTDYLPSLCTMFVGFSEDEIVLTIQKIMASSEDPFIDAEAVKKIIYDKKKQKMEGGILEYCKTEGSSIGGMENYRKWLENQIEPIKNSIIYKKKVGTNPPKGVLLCGIPGCGKSETAKFTANILKLPLLKMDIGSLMDKFVGGSEENMRNALKLAETMSPCVLWIDELEKGFSGAMGDNDTAGFKRMFAHMLGWMQENEKPCFIFATANDISALPKEFFRSGRFDALYAVYLPTYSECISIIKTCMDKAAEKVAKSKKEDDEKKCLFEAGCYSNSLLGDFINDELGNQNKPRIVIGSDIRKIVDTALRSLIDEMQITYEKWDSALRKAAKESVLYGDGEENIDSIALSYCRMLRKGFIPTGEVLFDKSDYHIKNIEQLMKLKSKNDLDMSDEEKQRHLDKIEEAQILKKSNKPLNIDYDKAVYDLLYSRINDMAIHIEKVEREKMIGR